VHRHRANEQHWPFDNIERNHFYFRLRWDIQVSGLDILQENLDQQAIVGYRPDADNTIHILYGVACVAGQEISESPMVLGVLGLEPGLGLDSQGLRGSDPYPRRPVQRIIRPQTIYRPPVLAPWRLRQLLPISAKGQVPDGHNPVHHADHP
jgi:hypothetical protein